MVKNVYYVPLQLYLTVASQLEIHVLTLAGKIKQWTAVSVPKLCYCCCCCFWLMGVCQLCCYCH